MKPVSFSLEISAFILVGICILAIIVVGSSFLPVGKLKPEQAKEIHLNLEASIYETFERQLKDTYEKCAFIEWKRRKYVEAYGKEPTKELPWWGDVDECLHRNPYAQEWNGKDNRREYFLVNYEYPEKKELHCFSLPCTQKNANND